MTVADSRLDKAISDKDVILVQTILLNHIDIDVNREEFLSNPLADHSQEKLKGAGVELFERDNGKFEFPPEERWNKDLWQSLKVEMRYNFSREKFDFILKMMKSLREKGDGYFQIKETNFTKNQMTGCDFKKETQDTQRCKSGHKQKNELVKATGATATVGAAAGFCIAKALTSSKLIWGFSSLLGGGIGFLAGYIYLTKNFGARK